MKKVIFVFNSVSKKLEYSNFIQDVRSYGHSAVIEVLLTNEFFSSEEEVLVFCETKQDFGQDAIIILLEGLGVHDVIQEISLFLC